MKSAFSYHPANAYVFSTSASLLGSSGMFVILFPSTIVSSNIVVPSDMKFIEYTSFITNVPISVSVNSVYFVPSATATVTVYLPAATGVTSTPSL